MTGVQTCALPIYDGLSLRVWDFLNETPHIDARGAWDPTSEYPHVESLMANAILTNGARYYVDHAHPEVSTPECATPSEVVLYDRAAEFIIQRSMERAAARLAPGTELIAYKNNSDGKGNSYGCHENYLVERDVPFGRLQKFITSHFVSRQVFCGAGKVGVENPRDGEIAPSFQLSQRADFFEEEVGLETTIRRPIVNTRDEPHADPRKWRRFHVILGDANMSPFATRLKVGTTALVLEALVREPGFAREWCALAKRAGMKGIQEWLSFYFKAPMHAKDLYPEHDLFIQLMKLKNTLRYMMGEELITHLGREYYD